MARCPRTRSRDPRVIDGPRPRVARGHPRCRFTPGRSPVSTMRGPVARTATAMGPDGDSPVVQSVATAQRDDPKTTSVTGPVSVPRTLCSRSRPPRMIARWSSKWTASAIRPSAAPGSIRYASSSGVWIGRAGLGADTSGASQSWRRQSIDRSVAAPSRAITSCIRIGPVPELQTDVPSKHRAHGNASLLNSPAVSSAQSRRGRSIEAHRSWLFGRGDPSFAPCGSRGEPSRVRRDGRPKNLRRCVK